MGLVQLYSSETWPLRAVNVQRLSSFKRRCLHSISLIWCEDFMSNLEVRGKLLDPRVQSLEQALKRIRLRWPGRVLCLTTE